VAGAIAAQAGADVEALPFRPVIRGMLLTGRAPTWLRASIADGRAADSVTAGNALWWPPSKIAGKRLAPALGAADADADAAAEHSEGGLSVEVELQARPAEAPGLERRTILAHVRGEPKPRLLDFEPGGHGL